MPGPLAPGPAMVSVAGLELSATDRERLRHPLTGGVILFADNYRDRGQLAALCAEIHSLRSPRLLIAVDHEGGRVQRFREGFTAIPPMRRLGERWDRDPASARRLAEQTGLVIAAELRACGVDLSLAPVLDVDHGASTVIGDRALHSDPSAVAELAGSLIAGLARGGMRAVGKHYPGHGYIRADSHLELPVDERAYDEIERCDLVPFRRLAAQGLAGIMPAHVLYPKIDARPAGFSAVWLNDILRGRLGFAGTVFSDDLGMEGAAGAGNMAERAQAAMDAGCDMVLVCNATGADQLFARFGREMPEASRARLARMFGQESPAVTVRDADYSAAAEAVNQAA